MLTIKVTERPGHCRWCDCSELGPGRGDCPGGCSWANATRTLCSHCFDLDRLIRTARGRRELATRMQELS